MDSSRDKEEVAKFSGVMNYENVVMILTDVRALMSSILAGSCISRHKILLMALFIVSYNL